MVYYRQSTFKILEEVKFENQMYSFPDSNTYSGWKWVHVQSLKGSHLSSAIRLQMLAIQHLEEILDPLLSAKGTLENHTQIHRNLIKMKNRYRRMSMLGAEYATRVGTTPFEEIPYYKKWLKGYTKIDGVYPYIAEQESKPS